MHSVLLLSLYQSERQWRNDRADFAAQFGRHSRESGSPVSCKQRRWVPAFAGTTIISCISPERHVDVLDLRACEQLLDRFLATDARLLVAAERHADPVLTRAVDPHVAGLDPGGEAVRAVEIVRPDRASQPDVERI